MVFSLGLGVRPISPRKAVYVDKTSKMLRMGLINRKWPAYKEKDIIFGTWNTRLEERSWRQRRMEAPFEWDRGPEGAVASYMMDGMIPTFVHTGQIDLHVIHVYTARFVCDIMIYWTTDILIYFTTDILIYFTTERINSYNQLDVHKICSSDVSKPPKSFGTSQCHHQGSS